MIKSLSVGKFSCDADTDLSSLQIWHVHVNSFHQFSADILHHFAQSQFRIQKCVDLRITPKLRRFSAKLFRNMEEILTSCLILKLKIICTDLIPSCRMFGIFRLNVCMFFVLSFHALINEM